MFRHRRAARAALSAAVATAPLTAGGGGASARVRDIPTNVNVSHRHGNQAETAVAINPLDPSNIVIASNVDSGVGLFTAVSRNGGRTWKRDIIGDDDRLGSICCDPSLSWDNFGNLFLTYVDFADQSSVPVALSTDGGSTFARIARIGNPNRTAFPAAGVRGIPSWRAGSFPFVDQPTVTAAQGEVWVSFNGGGPMYAAGARVLGPGQVGGFHAQIMPGSGPKNGFGSFGDISIGPQGQVLAVWQPTEFSQAEGPSTIFENLDPDGLGASGFHAARRITATNVGGFDTIPAQFSRTVDAEAELAWDRSGLARTGRLYLVYTDEFPNESNNMNVYVRHSDDNGTTWSDPVRVNDDRSGNSQFLPRISLDQTSGGIAVSWYDCRNDVGQGGPGDTDGRPNDDAQFFASFSTNGGAAFSPNLRVSQGTSNSADAFNDVDFGDYTGLDFRNGVARPAWADNSDSTGDNPDGRLHELDVYTAAVPADSEP